MLQRGVASLFLAAASVFALTVPASAGPGKTSSAESCAELEQARKEAFQSHYFSVTQLRKARGFLGELNTVDPALIDKRFKQWSAAIKDLRQKEQQLTPDERKMPSVTETIALEEEAYAFWQSKKAHEQTSGIVDVRDPGRVTATLNKRIKEAEAMEKASADQIAALDKQLEKCKTPKAGKNGESSSPWSGPWSDGTGGTVSIAVSGDTLSYTYEIGGKPFGQGRCTVHGTLAACKWSEQTSEEHSGTQVTRITSGHGSMTLVGTRVTVHFVTDRVSFNPSCPSLDCGPPKPGSVNDFGLFRKP